MSVNDTLLPFGAWRKTREARCGTPVFPYSCVGVSLESRKEIMQIGLVGLVRAGNSFGQDLALDVQGLRAFSPMSLAGQSGNGLPPLP
jgi:hypothetical protein